MTYDWRIDAYGCWKDAIAHKRLLGIITGEFAPYNWEKDYRWVW